MAEPKSMDVLLQEALRFDAGNDHDGLRRHAEADGWNADAISYIVYQLLLARRLHAAFALSNAVTVAGIFQPILSLAQALGGLVTGSIETEIRGTRTLAAIADALDADKRAMLYQHVMQPVFFKLIEAGYASGGTPVIMRILEIMKAGVPVLRTMFDGAARLPALDPAALAAQGRGRQKLLSQKLPPANMPRTPRRLVFAVRKFIFPGQANSKIFDLGERMQAATRLYGWSCELVYLGFQNLAEDLIAVSQRCAETQPDVLILDDGPIQWEANLAVRASLLQHLKAKDPALKIVGLHMDSWEIRADILIRSMDGLDAVWATTPSLAVWRDPVFAGRIVQSPLVHGGLVHAATKPLTGRATFIGAVKGYNWHRVLWKAATEQEQLPVDWQMSSLTEDGLAPIASYANYMQRLADSTAVVNFSMRPDLSLVITDRTFETPLAGALLVQEHSPDVDYFFTAGEHYLEFRSLAELRAIGDFLRDRPQEAEAIRRRGADFARARYADDKLLGALDQVLYRYSG
jgi:hypothetical protein